MTRRIGYDHTGKEIYPETEEAPDGTGETGAREIAEELIRLSERATPGPWQIVSRPNDVKQNAIADVRGVNVAGPYAFTSCGDEARYIAFANPENVRAVSEAYLALLEESEAQLDYIGQLEDEINALNAIGKEEPF